MPSAVVKSLVLRISLRSLDPGSIPSHLALARQIERVLDHIDCALGSGSVNRGALYVRGPDNPVKGARELAECAPVASFEGLAGLEARHASRLKAPGSPVGDVESGIGKGDIRNSGKNRQQTQRN